MVVSSKGTAMSSKSVAEVAKKAQPRRGSGQGSDSGAGCGSASHWAGAGHGEGPTDDGGREGKTIPTVRAPDRPP